MTPLLRALVGGAHVVVWRRAGGGVGKRGCALVDRRGRIGGADITPVSRRRGVGDGRRRADVLCLVQRDGLDLRVRTPDVRGFGVRGDAGDDAQMHGRGGQVGGEGRNDGRVGRRTQNLRGGGDGRRGDREHEHRAQWRENAGHFHKVRCSFCVSVTGLWSELAHPSVRISWSLLDGLVSD